jgi:hypothetical protein
MTSAVLQILADGHIIVDNQHPQAITTLQSLQSFSIVEAYVGRYVRCRLHRTALCGGCRAGRHCHPDYRHLDDG